MFTVGERSVSMKENNKIEAKMVSSGMKTAVTSTSTWDIISMTWFEKWKLFVDFDNQGRLNDSRSDETIQEMHPGPIDNTHLKGNFDDELRPGLVEGVDFVFLSQFPATRLYNKYTGGPRFTRGVVNVGTPYIQRLQISLYRVRFEVYHCTKDSPYPNKEDSKYFQIFNFDKTTPYKDIISDLRKGFHVYGIAGNTRFWLRENRGREDEGGERSSESSSNDEMQIESNGVSSGCDDVNFPTSTSSVTSSKRARKGRLLNTDVTDWENNWKYIRKMPDQMTAFDILGDKDCVELIMEVTEKDGKVEANWPRAHLLDKWRSDLRKDDIVDAQDKQRCWYEGVVLDVLPDGIQVHFRSWSSKFDEVIKNDAISTKIKPLHTMTKDRNLWEEDSKVEIKVSEPDATTAVWMAVTVKEIDRAHNKVLVTYSEKDRLRTLEENGKPKSSTADASSTTPVKSSSLGVSSSSSSSGPYVSNVEKAYQSSHAAAIATTGFAPARSRSSSTSSANGVTDFMIDASPTYTSSHPISVEAVKADPLDDPEFVAMLDSENDDDKKKRLLGISSSSATTTVGSRAAAATGHVVPVSSQTIATGSVTYGRARSASQDVNGTLNACVSQSETEWTNLLASGNNTQSSVDAGVNTAVAIPRSYAAAAAVGATQEIEMSTCTALVVVPETSEEEEDEKEKWFDLMSEDICYIYTHTKKVEEPKKTGFTSHLSSITSRGTHSSSYGGGSYSSYISDYDKHTKGIPPVVGAVGLSNLGNTCFMNSILQCLSNTQVLTELFLSGAYQHQLNTDNPLGHGGKLATVYAKLIKDMWNDGYTKIVPREFKTTIGEFQPQFAGYDQQDSQELMGFLLDGLHEDLNRVAKKPHVTKIESKGRDDNLISSESWRRYLLRNDSPLVDHCFGQLKSHVTCVNCKNESVTFDEFSSISLPIPIRNTRFVTVIVQLLPLGSTPVSVEVEVELHDTMSSLSAILTRTLKEKNLLPPVSVPSMPCLSASTSVIGLAESVPGSNNLTPSSSLSVCRDVSNLSVEDGFSGEKPHAMDTWSAHTSSVVSSGIADTSHSSAHTSSVSTITTTHPLTGALYASLGATAKRSAAVHGNMGGDSDTEKESDSMSVDTGRDDLDVDTEFELANNKANNNALLTSRSYTMGDESIDSPGANTANYRAQSAGGVGLETAENFGKDFRMGAVINPHHDLSALKSSTEYSANDDLQSSPSSSTYELHSIASNQNLAINTAIAVEIPSEDRVIHFQFGILQSHKPTTVNKNYNAVDHKNTAIVSFAGKFDQLIAFQMEHKCEEIKPPSYNNYSYGIYDSAKDKAAKAEKLEKERQANEQAHVPIDINIGCKVPGYYGNMDRYDAVGYPLRTAVLKNAVITNKEVHLFVWGFMKRFVTEDSRYQNAYEVGFEGVDDIPYTLMISASSYVSKKRDIPYDDEIFAIPPAGSEMLFVAWKEVMSSSPDCEYDLLKEVRFASQRKTSSIGFDDDEGGDDKPKISIYSCLDKFIEREQLDNTETLYCSNCKQHLAPIKKMDIWAAPDVLILHLKRFQYVPGQYFVHREKINELIDFPTSGLDLTNYVKGHNLAGDSSALPIYDLYAVSHHSGGLGGGHYTATCQNYHNKTWYNFNDSHVSESEASRAVSSTAYVLFYKRRTGTLRWSGIIPSAVPIPDEDTAVTTASSGDSKPKKDENEMV